MRMMDEQDYFRFRQGRGREKEVLRYEDQIRNCLISIEDIILVPNQKIVDLDALIDILSDSHAQEEESLELCAAKMIKTRGKQMDINSLAAEMHAQIKKLPIQQNAKRWWTTFKTANKSGERHGFEVKKVRELLKDMQGEFKPSHEQETAFKNRDMWTQNELLKACSQK